MNNNINLLPKKKITDDSQQVLLVFCKRLSIITLLLTAGMSVLFFLLTINPSFSSVKQQENSVLTSLSFTQGKIAKYVLIKNRLTGIEKILKNRYPMDNVLSTIQQKIPNDVNVDAISMTNKTSFITLSSPSLLSLNTALTNVSSLLTSKEIFKTITVQSIIANPQTGKYTVTLHADLL